MWFCIVGEAQLLTVHVDVEVDPCTIRPPPSLISQLRNLNTLAVNLRHLLLHFSTNSNVSIPLMILRYPFESGRS